MAIFIMALTINPNAKKEHPNLSHHINESLASLRNQYYGRAGKRDLAGCAVRRVLAIDSVMTF